MEKNTNSHMDFATDRTAASEALRVLYLRSHRALNTLMSMQGASFARAKLMLFIQRKGHARSTDIAEAFGFAPRTVTEAIDALEREGFVQRVPDSLDRRVKNIFLTVSGRQASAASAPIIDHFSDQLFGSLDVSEIRQLSLLLNKLNHRLAEIEKGLPAFPADDAGGNS